MLHSFATTVRELNVRRTSKLQILDSKSGDEDDDSDWLSHFDDPSKLEKGFQGSALSFSGPRSNSNPSVSNDTMSSPGSHKARSSTSSDEYQQAIEASELQRVKDDNERKAKEEADLEAAIRLSREGEQMWRSTLPDLSDSVPVSLQI